jgi:hypothetical protein
MKELFRNIFLEGMVMMRADKRIYYQRKVLVPKNRL